MSAKEQIVGLQAVAILEPTTGIPTILDVLDSATTDIGDEIIALKGGAANDAYEAEIINCNNSVTFTAKEFPPEVLAIMFRNTPTETAAEASGTVSAPTNKKGTSVVAATGIATIATTVGGTLKEGRYVIKATTATKFKIHSYSSIDGKTLIDDTTGECTVEYTGSTGTAIPIAELGITITCGASATAFTPGDTATFYIHRPNAGYVTTDIGGSTPGKYYEVWMFFQETTKRELSYVQYYRCLVSKGAWNNPIKDFHSMEYTITPTMDPANSNKIGKLYKSKS